MTDMYILHIYLEDNCFLSRVNVETGQVDEPYSNTAIACAVKDGYLYNERDGKRIRKNENGYLLRKNNDLKEKGLYTLIQYELPDREQMIQKMETNYLSPLSMIDPRVEISDYVLEYNSYGDKLFYLKQKDGNTELIQTDLDGNNEKVLKQYEDCFDMDVYLYDEFIRTSDNEFSIMVCEDKLVVMYEDQESNLKYDVVRY